MMRFVDVNPFFYPYRGGIEHRMHDTARLLAQRGHDVTIVTARLPDTEAEELTPEGYRIIRLESKFINIYNPPFVSSKGLLDTLESIDADVVNYNYRWAPSYNKDMARYDGPKVFTYHNMWGEGVGIQGKVSEVNDNSFAKNTLSTFDHIICVSKFVQDDLIRRGIPSEKTSFIPSCLPEDPLPNNSEEGDFILSLGRQVATKGLKYLIDAMQHVDCKLIMCGKGPEQKKLEKQISKLGLGDRVEMRGYVSDEEKMRLMDTCKFFVMPSEFESLGLAAIELMSHGRPIICSDADGLPETVGNAGVVVPKKDSKALADAINKLLADPYRRRELGRNAVERTKFYSWDTHIGDLERILQNVANQ